MTVAPRVQLAVLVVSLPSDLRTERLIRSPAENRTEAPPEHVLVDVVTLHVIAVGTSFFMIVKTSVPPGVDDVVTVSPPTS
ncbi:MAG: hypothetical protein E6F96_12845 [Actinobacteria bacterium]|nr:MAG: hypothetical protein E6F96_12845 [Actinomycetota bacterium]